MSRAEESLLNSKDDLLERAEGAYKRRIAAQRCWQAASRVLILTPLVLSIVLFVVYFRDVAKPLDLVASNTTTQPQITADKELERDFGILLHPKDHVLRQPNVLHSSWNITKAIIAPDGVEKNVFLINGTNPIIIIKNVSGQSTHVSKLYQQDNSLGLQSRRDLEMSWRLMF